jgi:hypothetical protein
MKKNKQPVQIIEPPTISDEDFIKATVERFNSGDIASVATLPPTESILLLAATDLDSSETHKYVFDTYQSYKKRRTSIERLRKELKDLSLKTGKAIDEKARELTAQSEPIELKLLALLDAHKALIAQREEDARKALERMVSERVDKLASVGYQISSIAAQGLSIDDFNSLYENAETQWAIEQARKQEEEKRANERALEIEAKERELKLREDTLWLKEARLTPARPIRVPATIEQDLANQILGDNYGVDWAYENDGVIWEKDEEIEPNQDETLPPYDSSGGYEMPQSTPPPNAAELTQEEFDLMVDQTNANKLASEINKLNWPAMRTDNGNLWLKWLNQHLASKI